MIRSPGSFRLIRLFGIRVGVDASWFLVLFLMIFSLSGPFRDAVDASRGVAYGTAVASALLFFASIVLHELGHAVAARREGIEVLGIDLWFLGGLAKLSRESNTPGEEFRVAVAGPVVTLLVIGACVGGGIAAVGPDRFYDALVLSRHASSPVLVLVSWLGLINALLLLLNLLPAYPLDGGRIARAAVWRATGNRERATAISARVGQAFGYTVIAAGIYLALQGLVPEGVSCALLGWIMAQSARALLLQAAFAKRIDGVVVADIMEREPVSVDAGVPLDIALDEYFARYSAAWLPVVDLDGRLLGVLQEEQARAAAGPDPAESAMEPVGDRGVSEQQPLQALLASEPLRRHGALTAVDGEGVLRGVVTLEQVRRALAVAVDTR